MTLAAKDLKRDLRRDCRRTRASLSPAKAAAADRAILRRLLALESYRVAGRVHTYVDSKPGEVATGALLVAAWAAGKEAAVPVVAEDRRLRHARLTALAQLERGPSGVRQPGPDHGDWLADLAGIDLVVVPGLAFDAGGGRLGFGAGYYDRFLAEVSAPKVGLVYRALLLDEVPQEDPDIAMDIVITEEQTIFCKESFP